jgi:CopG family transcriptional regulator, nickel-responsive regulator
MKASLARFGVAMDAPLLSELDALVERRRTTRSKVLSDLARAEIMKSQKGSNLPAVAALTIVYDHHVRELMDKLTELQHELGDAIRATMHVHLEHDHCLEVIVMRGPTDELQDFGKRILGTRGVKHGGIEIVTERGLSPGTRGTPQMTRSKAAHRAETAQRRSHSHSRANAHPHPRPDARKPSPEKR